jgi:hypothetical protein
MGRTLAGWFGRTARFRCAGGHRAENAGADGFFPRRQKAGQQSQPSSAGIFFFAMATSRPLRPGWPFPAAGNQCRFAEPETLVMEVKVQCECGTRYAFDVEPVNGRMPVRINCPGCSADGTDLANEAMIRRRNSRRQTALLRRLSCRPPLSSAAAALTAATFAFRRAIRFPCPRSRRAVAHFCPRHPKNPATETCRVCGKPICDECMEQFGYVCSTFCRKRARTDRDGGAGLWKATGGHRGQGCQGGRVDLAGRRFSGGCSGGRMDLVHVFRLASARHLFGETCPTATGRGSINSWFPTRCFQSRQTK